MEFRAEEYAERLAALLAAGDEKAVATAIAEVQPADVAHAARHLPRESVVQLLKLVPEEISADILVLIDEDLREDILASLTPQEIADVVEEMESDDAADVVAELAEDKAGKVVDLLEEEDRLEIAQLLTYPEDSAGGIMQVEVVSVREDRTVARAIEKIRLAAADIHEDIYFVYVTDAAGKLLGRLPLPRLLLANPEDQVRTLMDEETLSVLADADQEDVAQMFKKYDLPSLPVVDYAGRLLGRITIDDVVDVIHEEAEEDYSRMAGTDEEEFREDSIYRKAMLRLPWLVTGLAGGVLSALVFSHFEVDIQSVIALAFFVPVITAMGGNVAIQSSAVMVRGLATGEITPRGAFSRLVREGGVAVITGLVCAALIFVAAWAWRGPVIGAVVGGSMLAVILIATSVGAFVPLVLDRLHIDPALATGPFVTTTNDILGILVYLSFATWVLRSF
jgi:magnesium transporter